MHVGQAEVRREWYDWHDAHRAVIEEAWLQLQQCRNTLPLFSRLEWVQQAVRQGLPAPCGSILVRHGGRPIGLLPLRRRTRWTAEAYTILTPDYPLVLWDPQHAETFWNAVAAWIRSTPGHRVIALGRWADRRQVAIMQRAGAAAGMTVVPRPVAEAVWLRLPSSWETYLASLGKWTRRRIRQTDARLTESDTALQYQMVCDPGAVADEALSALIEFHRLRWQSHGSLFVTPHVATYYRALIQQALAEEAGCLNLLRVDGKIIAVQTAFLMPEARTMYCHLTARDMDQRYGDFGPGFILQYQAYRWAIDQGYAAVNIGQGQTSMKRNFGGTSLDRWEVFMASSSLAYRALTKIDTVSHLLQELPARVHRRLARRERQHIARPG